MRFERKEMANDIEQRQFVDKTGLEQFWDDIQIYLTRKYKELPPGMQFSRIYQENGRLHILVEPFGGSTEDCKAASRANLDVYSKSEIDANYKTKQDGVSEQFTEYQTLLDISQDANGEISMRKQVIPTATVGTLGLTTLKGVVSAGEDDNSTAATPKAVADAIAATIAGLDVSEVSIGKAKTVGTISEVDGKIVVTAVDILVDNANIADGAVTGSKIDDGAVTYDKVTNTEDHPFPIDISGNAATATNVQKDGELDQRIDAIENGKADKVTNATPGNLVQIDTTPDADNKYGIVDSTAHITQSYAPNDTVNPATGSAIKSGFDTEIAKLDRTVQSYDPGSGEPAPKVKMTVTQTDGALTAVVVDDSNAASKAQGDKADTAIQTVKVREINGSTDTTTTLQPIDSAVTVDLRDYKHLQSTVSDPSADGTGLAFIDSITQDETGVIHPHKKTVAVDSTYSASGTNPVNGHAVAAAIADLDSTETSQAGQNVQVTVTQADGKITRVSITDNSANASDIDAKINALDVSNEINEGEYITSLSETDGKIVVYAEAMDSTPTGGSVKPVTSGGVYNAIASLDVSDLVDDTEGSMAGKTLKTLSETDGKISADFQDIAIVKAQVTDFPEAMPPTPHSHGSITDDGAITDTGVAIGNNDTLVIADNSDSGTLKQTTITFDGSTATKALTQKGTWESFKPTQVAVTEAIEDTGSTLTFISSVTQDTDGVITPKTKTVMVDNAMNATSTNPVQNKVVNTALGTKVDKYTIIQQDAYQCFCIIEDVTRWYNHTGNYGITKFYQMIGWLSWWRNGTGHDQVGTAFMKYHLNYAWKLDDTNCFELEYTAPEEKIFPALLRDARDPNNVKYYFGLRTTIAWASTIQFVGRQRDHNFNNIAWIHGAGDSTELPTGVTILRGPTPMKWHTKSADYLATPRKLAVSLSNVSTDTTFSGTADVTNIKTTGILGIAHGGTGTNTAEGASNALLSGLPEWSAAPLDATYMIRQNTSGAATFGRVPFSTVWSYFKGKMDSDTGVDISGNAATATSANISITSDSTNGDRLQIGSGTPVNIGNAAHADSAERLATPRTVYVTLGTASTSSTRDFSGDTTIPVDGILPVTNGGTGASSVSAARTNLDVYSKEEVNSAITAAAAEFLGTLNLTDLGLSYGATNEQIATALNAHVWDQGVIPDNNDYCFVAINNPQTTDVDEYRRFKFDGTIWKYEYTLNNSSFTQAQWDAINSGITDVDKAAYDSHLGNTSNPHSVTKAQVGLGNVVNTGDSNTPVSGGTTKFTTGGAYTELNKKADKVANATTGDLASLDGNGNLVDSGISATNVKTKQTAVADPTAAGEALSFIDSITQNANGEITPTKKIVLVDSAYSANGTNPVNGTAVAAAINTLAVSNITGFGASKTLASLTETDGKIAATFQDINISGRQIIDSDTEPTEDSGNTVTSGGVKAALDAKADDADVVHLAGVEHITGEKFFDGGYSLTNSFTGGYTVFTLPGNSMWKKYDDWASEQKDRAHFRESRLMFPTEANYWGKIRITITGGYSSFNASGILSKTINMAVNRNQCYLNVGAYDALGYNVENEFRISDLVWNSTDSRWEVIIHSVKPQSNNQNQFVIIECWATQQGYLDYGRQITWVNRQASIVTDTTYRNAWREMTFNWSDQPVFQSPYGYKIFDESMTIPSSNLGVSAIPTSVIDSLA